jgi:hypothetical protein
VLSARIASLPSAIAADDYVAGSPGLLCEAPAQIVETLRHTEDNNMQALNRPMGCRLIENGVVVRILSRDKTVAKVTAGTGPTAVTGYMPVQSIINARGDPID